jgi:hypothetical protein
MRKIFLTVSLLAASAMAASAAVISGTYTISSNGATVTDDLTSPFSINLTVGTPYTVNFANIYENHDGSSNVVTAFTFTSPVSGALSLTQSDVFSTPGSSAHDTLSSVSPTAITFSDGAILDISLAGGTYNGNFSSYTGITDTITFNLVQAPTSSPVPEPMTLSLFGGGLAALASLAMLRGRDRKAG